jgi:hypothetical protein
MPGVSLDLAEAAWKGFCLIYARMMSVFGGLLQRYFLLNIFRQLLSRKL